MFTKTPWYGVPIAYAPLLLHNFINWDDNLLWSTFLMIFGVFCWSLSEYLLHRFLFHCEDYWLPKWDKICPFHFLLHGIHHCYPQDRLRLVFPILPGYIILNCLLSPLLAAIFPKEWYYEINFGVIFGYILYDEIHYFLHHSQPKKGYFRDLKIYHMQHHYKHGLQGFGVSSKFWDYVFQSQIR